MTGKTIRRGGGVSLGEQITATGALGRGEQAWLRLVFCGPVSWWVPLARLMGVRVHVPADVDDPLLAEAEAGALLAVRRFWPGLLATAVAAAALLSWLPIQREWLEGWTHGTFHTIANGMLLDGSSAWLSLLVATTTMVVFGLIAGLCNAFVFGGVPLLLLRRCTKAAAPTVGVAMAQRDDAFADEQAQHYPRLAYAARVLLHPRTRWSA